MKTFIYILEAFLLILLVQTCAFGQSPETTGISVPLTEIKGKEKTVESTYAAYKEALECSKTGESTREELEKTYNEFVDQVDLLHIRASQTKKLSGTNPESVMKPRKPIPVGEI